MGSCYRTSFCSIWSTGDTAPSKDTAGFIMSLGMQFMSKVGVKDMTIIKGKGKDYWDNENIIEEMPSCRQMFNIFHPSDPVAYRIEPFVCRDYFNTRPVIIPYHKGGKRLHIGFQEFVEDVKHQVPKG